jgi:hypothetical protein
MYLARPYEGGLIISGIPSIIPHGTLITCYFQLSLKMLIMKNLFVIIGFAFVLMLTGCSKDELYDPIAEETTNINYILDNKGDTFDWITMTSESDNKTVTIPDPSIDLVICRGVYQSGELPITNLTWNAFCDETGIYGTAEIRQTTPTYGFHFVMTTEGLVAEGNQAVHEGTITEVIKRWGDVPNFDVSWRFAFNVIDTQKQGYQEYDKISNTIMFATPRSPMLFTSYPPDDEIWSRMGYQDVMPPGFVEVSHNPEVPQEK